MKSSGTPRRKSLKARVSSSQDPLPQRQENVDVAYELDYCYKITVPDEQ